MSKHTKGPWRVDGRFVYGSGRKLPLAEFPPHGVVHSGVDAANARLMAAAPELLEALKAVMNGQMAGNPDMNAARFQQAHATIAKAEGRA